MCGIVGFTGNRQAAPILLDGLSKLEYRGYDSAGMAVRDGENLAQVVKAKGRLSNLIEKTDGGKALKGTCGIGHTRWATHGEPSQTNAHPHVSGNCTRSGSGPVESEVVGVHNGIIENYTELKEKLLKHGYTFYSQTDTEVVVKLVDYYYKKYNLGPIDAIAKTMVRVRGSYALELMFRDYPGEIWVARKDSPMIIGIADGETYVASDVPAILKYTSNVYYIGNLEFAKLVPGEAHFYDLNGDEIEKLTTEIKWDAEAAEKGGFEHFMMKEIHEQPKAVQDTLNSVIKNGVIELSSVEITEDEIKNFEQIYIVACGSAWHVGMAAQYVLEDMADIPVRVELASEFRYRKMPLNQKALVIVVSQSGETADTLAALRLAKERASPQWQSLMWWAAASRVKLIKCSTHLLDRKSLLLRQRHTVHSLPLCTAWQCSLRRSEAKSRMSSTDIIFLNCRLSLRRYRRFWKTKSVSSGSRQSTPTLMMCSLLVVVSTMQSAWKAA